MNEIVKALIPFLAKDVRVQFEQRHDLGVEYLILGRSDGKVLRLVADGNVRGYFTFKENPPDDTIV